MNVKYGVLIALLLALCPVVCLAAPSEPIVYDPSVPLEECCTVMLASTLMVSAFDGDAVHWETKGLQSWVAIQIPAGPHDFVLDYSRSVSTQGKTHYAKAVQFRYEDFIAGHTYRMWAAEGAEARGFSGMLKDITGSMKDTVNKKLTIMVEDITK